MEAALRTAYFTLKGARTRLQTRSVRSAVKDSRKTQESRKRSLRSETLSARRQSAALKYTETAAADRARGSPLRLCRSHGMPGRLRRRRRTADPRRRGAGVLREAESSMRWTQKQNCATPMRTRISGRSTAISLESRCPHKAHMLLHTEHWKNN